MKEQLVINAGGESSSKRLRGVPRGGRDPTTVRGLAKSAAILAVQRAMSSVLRQDPPGSRRIKSYPIPRKALTSYAPAAIGRTMISSAPRTTSSKGSVTISHRELIEGSIIGSTAFGVAASFNLQPGDKKSFPWLSIQASQYEQYRFKKLQFHYVPIVGTSVAGDVMLLADYNVLDPPPVLEVDALDHPRAKSGSLWEPHTFTCDISQMHALGPRKFIRTTAVAGDPKTYDCGQFHLCINNSGVVSAVGKLFIEYTVELFVPQINPNSILDLRPSQTSFFENGVTQLLTDNVPLPVVFSNTRKYDPLRIFPIGATTATSFTPPAGVYRICATVVPISSAFEATTFTLYIVKNAVSVLGQTRFAGTTITTPTLMIENILAFNGTDTFTVSIIWDGIAATTSIQYCNLILNLA